MLRGLSKLRSLPRGIVSQPLGYTPAIWITARCTGLSPIQLYTHSERNFASTSLYQARRETSMAMNRKAKVEEEEEEVEDNEQAVYTEKRVPFSDIESSLSPPLYKAITKGPMKFQTMSAIQAEILGLLPQIAASPSVTAAEGGKHAQDILARAKTGTGKTLAFLVPAIEGRLSSIAEKVKSHKKNSPDASPSELQRMLHQYMRGTVGSLIVTPTRELALQIQREAKLLTSHLPGFGVKLFLGGESKQSQIADFLSTSSFGGNDIVVGTPGRLLDVLQDQAIAKPMGFARCLVLDEADTLLDMGFDQDITELLKFLPPKSERQTFLFSATVSRSIRETARKSLKPDHLFINTVNENESDTHDHIPQYVTVVEDPEDQIPHILRLIAQDQLLAAQAGKLGKTIVFCPTTKHTQIVGSIIADAAKDTLPSGTRTEVHILHSKKEQGTRSKIAERFRRARTPAILVTSDVSARGVDYPGTSRVIQIGAAPSRDMYVHRVGRTGRAGKSGRGDLILLPHEASLLRDRDMLGDLSLKPCTVAETKEETEQMAKTAAGQKFPGAFRRLQDLQGIVHEDIIPRCDVMDVREAYLSLFGYYKSTGGLRSLQGTKESLDNWCLQALKVDPPYVSERILQGAFQPGRRSGGFAANRLGGSDNRSGAGGRYAGRGDRSGYGGDRNGYGGDRSGYGGDRSRYGGDRIGGGANSRYGNGAKSRVNGFKPRRSYDSENFLGSSERKTYGGEGFGGRSRSEFGSSRDSRKSRDNDFDVSSW